MATKAEEKIEGAVQSSALVRKVETAMEGIPEYSGGDAVSEFSRHIEARFRIAQMFYQSELYKKRHKTPEALMVIQLAAFELGVPFTVAAGCMYAIDGKVAMEGQLMLALAINRAGVSVELVERTPARYAAVLKRSGWDDMPIEYTMEDAVRAGLVKAFDAATGIITPASIGGGLKLTYKKHPQDMLQWRALSAGLRVMAPDVFANIYWEGELAHAIDAENTKADRDLSASLHAPLDEPVEILTGEAIEELTGLMFAAMKADPLQMDKDEKEKWDTAISSGDCDAVREAVATLKERADPE